jgi:hypothetical protein
VAIESLVMALPPDDVVILARRQHGLLTRQQALHYLSESRLGRLVGPGGRWQIPLRGICATFTGALTQIQRRYAAWMYAGPEALITGLEGCRLYGLRRVPPSDLIQFLIPHHIRRQSRSYVVIRRARFFPTRHRIVEDVPVAPLARCIIDATRDLRSLDEIRSLMMEAVQRHMVTVAQLQTELEIGSIAWSARPRIVITEMLGGARSVPEAGYIKLMASSKILPPMHHNCTLLTPESEFLAVPDGYIKSAGLAGEIQSVEHHADTREQEADMERRAKVGRYVVHVIEARPTRIGRDPEGLLAHYEATYLERLAAGITPNVLLKCRPDCPLAHESDVGPETPQKPD